MCEQSQVDRVAALNTTTGPMAPFFGPEHPLARLVPARWTELCQALSCYDINLQFNQSADPDDPRSVFRLDYASLLGPGMDLLMPTAGAYMCWPGRNRVVLPTRTDPTIVSYLQGAGFLGEVVYYEGNEQTVAGQRAAGRRTYSIDDMGPDGDDVAANSLRDMTIGNSKERVAELSAYAAPELRRDMFEVGDADFHATHAPGRRVFLKTCNTESAGEGIHPVATLEEFRAALEKIRDTTRRYQLNPLLVIQPELVGTNKSFQVFLHPDGRPEIPVVALTDQLIGPDGKKYAGSVNHHVTAARLEVVGPAIIDMVDRLRALCPGAVGFLMCDYFEAPDGTVAIYDPGLRPSGNTGAAMVKRWVEEATGQYAAVTMARWLEAGKPGMSWAEVATLLGPYTDPGYICTHRLGALPRGHNHLQGKTRFIVVTPTHEDYAPFRKELEERLGKA
jgi:hypothetical protein